MFYEVIGIITDFMYSYWFLVPVLAYLCLLLGSSFVHWILAFFWCQNGAQNGSQNWPQNSAKRAQSQTPSRDPPGVDFGVVFGRFWGSFWGPFWEHFDMIFNDSCKYAQIRADTSTKAQRRTKYVQMRADTRKYAQIHANTRKYAQIRAGTRTYVQIRANTCKHVQIHTDTRMHIERIRQTATSNCRERHSAACGDTCLQVWLLSRASRSLTRQVFKRGSKSALFRHRFLHRFWSGFGVIFWTKIRWFSTFFGIHFLAMTFHVIMLVLGPVCVPLDVPKLRFYCRKTVIFMDLHVLAKLLELSQILWIFIDFWCQLWRINAYF